MNNMILRSSFAVMVAEHQSVILESLATFTTMNYALRGWDLTEFVDEIYPSVEWRRSSRVWMRSSQVVRASDCQCRSRNSPGIGQSILRLSGIWDAADEAVLNKVIRGKNPKTPLLIMLYKRPIFYLEKGVQFVSMYCCQDFRDSFCSREYGL